MCLSGGEKGNCGRKKIKRDSCSLGKMRLGESGGSYQNHLGNLFDPHSNQVKKLLLFVSLLLIRRGLIKCNQQRLHSFQDAKPSFCLHQGFLVAN